MKDMEILVSKNSVMVNDREFVPIEMVVTKEHIIEEYIRRKRPGCIQWHDGVDKEGFSLSYESRNLMRPESHFISWAEAVAALPDK